MEICPWARKNLLLEEYHNQEWGIPVHNDQMHFEMLCLEGAHAGLSWEIILRKRSGYREAFHQFDVVKCSTLTDDELNQILTDTRVIRNRLKIYSVRKNALAFIEIQKQFGSFDQYIWQFVDRKTIQNAWKAMTEVPSNTSISDAIAKDLKKRGMSFVGSTIIYAYMQAIGMVSDHLVSCCRYSKA